MNFSFGSKIWPGISKLIEEIGELAQACGKGVMTNFEDKPDWHKDYVNQRRHLEEEMADVIASIVFVVDANGLDKKFISQRVEEKLVKFENWHKERKNDDEVNFSHVRLSKSKQNSKRRKP